MGLSKYRIGELISVVDERNDLGLRDFYGININKEFMPTVADTEGLDEKKYKVVRKNRFVFSGMQTGRDQCIRISMYNQESPIIVSPAYTTFEIADSANDVVIPMYFFMLFLSKEKDRLGAFYSDGSIRSNLDWERFCDIEILLPSKDIQHKYVDIYNAALKNQQCYERGVNDLKMVCDGYIENLRRKLPSKKIGEFIQEKNSRNSDLHSVNVQGVNSSSSFGETKADTNGLDFTNYKIVKNKQFAYNPSRINLGSIALFEGDECIVSPMYCVFSVDEDFIIPEYLMLWFTRKEFQRSTFFYAMGSVRDTFDFGLMKDVSIPVPSKEIQQAIVDIYMSYMQRQRINDILKNKIKSLCPVLIKGSILEAQ